MKYVRIIDQNGLFIEDAFVEELTPFTIEEPCPQGFILPKWNGLQWIEGGVKPIVETIIEPTIEERLTTVEISQDDIISVLAEIVGVTL